MIFVTGDCHGDYRRFEKTRFPAQELMDRYDYVICCGDFGFWADTVEQNKNLDWLEERGYTILWVDGNHENFDLLKKIPLTEWHGGLVQFIRPHIIRLLRGQMYQIQGKRFFTFGGARSSDITDGILEGTEPDYEEKRAELIQREALFRVNHVSWWKEEMPTREEMDNGFKVLEQNNWKTDYIITHAAPTSVQAYLSCYRYSPDPLTEYFQSISERCAFKRWFFGHYHFDDLFFDRYQLLYKTIKKIC